MVVFARVQAHCFAMGTYLKCRNKSFSVGVIGVKLAVIFFVYFYAITRVFFLRKLDNTCN